ncbi:MAG: tRNA lysidine(34) synthetase TilS [Proteobacteria bacterium]|nr:tRNA lysidine(34) synthetase TilS [Pseudomonadota bacterium]
MTHALAALPPGALVVGYSGGADSSVLLHALAHDPGARDRGLRAVHVDHGLHADSAAWAQHCRATAAALDVALDVVRVEVDRSGGRGLEAAARAARRAAFARALHSGEILALAHHRDDQAETVLLKLLRGAGPEGLAGMRRLRAFGDGQLWRPLLELPRAALLDYAREHGLRWLEDPSNADTTLRRNFLRAEILPRLRARWPDAQIALAHSALWAGNATDFIEAETRKALAQLQGLDPATLAWRGWLALPDALRDPVLRLWLRELRLDEPAHFHLEELQRQLRDAREDRLPCLRFADTELRRYRDLLYALRPLPAFPADWESAWDGSASLPLPGGGALALSPPRKLEPPLVVRYRRGGERIKPAGSAHTRELRLLLQEAGVPPWLRERIPLVFRDGELVAVGDLFFADAVTNPGMRIRFDPAVAR